MIREEYLRRLIDAAHVDLYLSANDGARVYWPWRMQPPKEATKSYRDACERYVVDSDPEDDDVTTRDVLDTAFRLDAEVASLADAYQDKPATVESLLDGLETADDHPFDGTLLLPLQDPHVECYREIGEPRGHWIGVGGLKDASDRERIQASASLREEFGHDTHIHGFGWGPRESMASEIRRRPGLIDSIDYSSPCRSLPTGVLPGDEVMSVQAAYSAAQLVRDLRRVSPYVDDGGIESGEQASVGYF